MANQTFSGDYDNRLKTIAERAEDRRLRKSDQENYYEQKQTKCIKIACDLCDDIMCTYGDPIRVARMLHQISVLRKV